VRISQEYTVKLPLVDTVDLKDKTARQAEEYIRELYGRDFLAKPQVNLFVLEYAPRRVFVAGSVATPGVVLFQQEQGLTLIDAISRAGSFNRLADKKRVTLKRTKPDGSTETFTINVDDVMKGDTNQTWPLQPNDVITIPEKIL
jgi:polysaccharide export outer membrane protein